MIRELQWSRSKFSAKWKVKMTKAWALQPIVVSSWARLQNQRHLRYLRGKAQRGSATPFTGLFYLTPKPQRQRIKVMTPPGEQPRSALFFPFFSQKLRFEPGKASFSCKPWQSLIHFLDSSLTNIELHTFIEGLKFAILIKFINGCLLKYRVINIWYLLQFNCTFLIIDDRNRLLCFITRSWTFDNSSDWPR